VHRLGEQWLRVSARTSLTAHSAGHCLMLALLLDTCDWLTAETKSLARVALRWKGGKALSRGGSGIENKTARSLSDPAQETGAGVAPVGLSTSPLAIALGRSDCLRRPLTAIRLRKSHLEAMADLDIATTPIKREDVVIYFERRTAESVDNAYFVVRRDVHASIVHAARAQRHGDVEIVFTEDGRTYRLDPRPHCSDGAALRLLTRGLTALVLLSAGAVAADAVVALAAAKHKLGQEIARFDLERTAIGRARAQIARVDEVRQMLDRTVLARRNPAELLDALATALPDHAWLTDVRMSDGIIEIVGISTAPMELPSLVSASRSFDGAGFQGDVVKAVGDEGERFRMRMEVAR